MHIRYENFRLPATQRYLNLKGEESNTINIDFGSSPETMKSNYLDVYEGVHTDMIYTNRFDESSDLSTMYLGRTTVIRDIKIKVEEKFPILGQGYSLGKLMDGTECQILLDTGVNISYMIYPLQDNMALCVSSEIFTVSFFHFILPF